MALIWYEYVIIAAIFAGILALGMYGGQSYYRVKVQKWIGGALGNFMTNLANEAEKEGGNGGGSPGMLKFGSFQVDVGTIKELLPLIPQILQIAKMFGLTSGGGGGGGGKIGL